MTWMEFLFWFTIMCALIGWFASPVIVQLIQSYKNPSLFDHPVSIQLDGPAPPVAPIPDQPPRSYWPPEND